MEIRGSIRRIFRQETPRQEIVRKLADPAIAQEYSEAIKGAGDLDIPMPAGLVKSEGARVMPTIEQVSRRSFHH